MRRRARTRKSRVLSVGLAMTVLSALVVVVAGSVIAAPGRNNDNAKLCKDWSELYREDGSMFIDRSDCTSYAAMGGVILTSPPTTTTTQPVSLPYQVIVEGGPAPGTYPAAGSEFGPAPTSTGVAGSLVLANDGTANSSQGCSPLVGFPAGAIAVIDRGGCDDDLKVANAQAAGAVAVVVANNVSGVPTMLSGDDTTISIPAVVVSQDSGATIKIGLPAIGRVEMAP